MKYLLAALFTLIASTVFAQATHIITSATLPTSCTVGDIYEKTGTSAGFYHCTATNVWTLITTPTGAALTKTDDSNVTLTLGGSPTTALVNAASITVGWSGNLAYTRGGCGAWTPTSGGVVIAGASACATDTDLTFATDTLTATKVSAPTSVTTPLIQASANLTLNPTGDLITDPVGNDILPVTNYDINIGSPTLKYLSFSVGELLAETLVAKSVMATIGGQIMVAPTTLLTADLASGGTTITVKHNNLVNGHRVYLQGVVSGTSQFEAMAIASAASGSGPYTYTVTRNLDGSGANNWYAGDAVLDTGTTGDGYINLYSDTGFLGTGAGPTIVGNVRTGTTWNNIEPRWAIGNLNGLYGYAATTYGAAFGAPTGAWVKIDPTNGVRMGFNNDVNLKVDPSGNLMLGPLSASGFASPAAIQWPRSTAATGGGQAGDRFSAYGMQRSPPDNACGACDTIKIENKIVGLPVGSGGVNSDAFVYVVAQGWKSGGSGSNARAASLKLASGGVQEPLNNATLEGYRVVANVDDSFQVFDAVNGNFSAAMSSSGLSVSATDAGVSGYADRFVLGRQSTGTVSSGFGLGQVVQLESANGTVRDASRLSTYWTTATDASRTSALDIQLVDSATTKTPVTIGPSNMRVWVSDAATNTAPDVLTLLHDTSDAAAAGFGVTVLAQLEAEGTTYDAARLSVTWSTASGATRTSKLAVQAVDAATSYTALELLGNGRSSAFYSKLATASVQTALFSRWQRPQTGGTKYANTVDWKLGSWSANVSAESQLDLCLSNGATDNPDNCPMIWYSNGRVFLDNGVGTGTGGNYLCIDTTSYEILRGNGSSCTASAGRFKQNIKPLAYGIDEVRRLRPSSYVYRPETHMGDGTHLGFVAEDVNLLIPEAVTRQSGRIYGLNYDELIAVLVKAVQDLDKQVQELKTKVR